jgi:hypothetical protein
LVFLYPHIEIGHEPLQPAASFFQLPEPMLSTEVIERGASFGLSDGVCNRSSESFDRFMGPLLSSRIAKSAIIL